MKEHEKITKLFEMRHKIAKDHCIKKGWPLNIEDLTIDQVIEIRKLPAWKDVPNVIEKMANGEVQSNS